MCSRGLEGWEPELIASVFLPENAKKEAIHEQQNSTPYENGELLGPRIFYARNLKREGDSGKRKDAI
jgi:hypothetical protein